MKYLYILVSTPNDIYLEQAFISITSLKMRSPEVHVALFIDERTEKTLTENRAKIKEIVNEIIVEKFDENINNLKRSRILKTLMRNRIDGDFLYIDSDTIICNNLEEIENCEFDLAAVLDQHTLSTLSTQRFSILGPLKTISNDNGFIQSCDNYFNGGLLFVRDTKTNRKFFTLWNKNYLLGCKKGVPIDMPSLALTNYQFGFPIKELDGKWNCQIWNGANYIHNAKILHYFASEGAEYEPFSLSLPLTLKEYGILSKKDLELISNPKGHFGNPNFIITGSNYEIYRSNIGGFLRYLYKHKFLFKLIDKLFVVLRLFNAKRILRGKNK